MDPVVVSVYAMRKLAVARHDIRSFDDVVYMHHGERREPEVAEVEAETHERDDVVYGRRCGRVLGKRIALDARGNEVRSRSPNGAETVVVDEKMLL